GVPTRGVEAAGIAWNGISRVVADVNRSAGILLGEAGAGGGTGGRDHPGPGVAGTEGRAVPLVAVRLTGVGICLVAEVEPADRGVLGLPEADRVRTNALVVGVHAEADPDRPAAGERHAEELPVVAELLLESVAVDEVVR